MVGTEGYTLNRALLYCFPPILSPSPLLSTVPPGYLHLFQRKEHTTLSLLISVVLQLDDLVCQLFNHIEFILHEKI